MGLIELFLTNPEGTRFRHLKFPAGSWVKVVSRDGKDAAWVINDKGLRETLEGDVVCSGWSIHLSKRIEKWEAWFTRVPDLGASSRLRWTSAETSKGMKADPNLFRMEQFDFTIEVTE